MPIPRRASSRSAELVVLDQFDGGDSSSKEEKWRDKPAAKKN